MNRLSAPLAHRRLLVATLLLVAVAATGLLTTGSASALVIAGPGVCRYYSDATYTNVVGTRSVGCCGEITNSGTVTPYVRCQRVFCPDVVCPNAS